MVFDNELKKILEKMETNEKRLLERYVQAMATANDFESNTFESFLLFTRNFKALARLALEEVEKAPFGAKVLLKLKMYFNRLLKLVGIASIIYWLFLR